jgi:hypothetical protein
MQAQFLTADWRSRAGAQIAAIYELGMDKPWKIRR